MLLYLNIEQYEYTKDPGRGVGIKVRGDQSIDDVTLYPRRIDVS